MCAVASLAQGTFYGSINVGNRVLLSGIDAPVFDTDCVTRLAGTNFLVQAYIGFTPDSLAPMGDARPFRTGQYAGYFVSHIVNVPDAAGRLVYVQLRAWEATAGTSYEAAVAAGGKYGFSNVVPVIAIAPPGPPADLVGLQSFCLVPEPGAGALLALGGGLWLLLARRRTWWKSERIISGAGERQTAGVNGGRTPATTVETPKGRAGKL